MTSRLYSRDSHILADAVIDPLAPDTCGGDACRSCRGGLGAGCQGLGHRHGGFEGAPLVDGAWLLVPWTVKAEFVGTVDRENLANTQEPEGEIEQARSSDELARPLLQRDAVGSGRGTMSATGAAWFRWRSLVSRRWCTLKPQGMHAAESTS